MVYYPSNYKYSKENLLKVMVAFNRRTEPELVEWMEEKENKAGYIKGLVRDDIERSKEEEKKEEEK